MNLFDGKSKQERNKIIAALVLGVLALVSLFFAFGPSLTGGGSTTATVNVPPAPSPSASAKTAADNFALPTQEQQTFDYQTTPVVYTPGSVSTPDAGRNIFAFYEPPKPCPECAPPPPINTPKPATPTPTPPMIIAMVNPQTVYAGTGGFKLEVSGDKFDPSAHIYFNQGEIPTNFVNAQRLTADIPANFIAGEGARTIIVQTPDGKKYSNQVILTVQAPPAPQFQYVGMIARKRYNNDTAYFQEQGKQTPTAARLNDVVGGRFKLISISADETVFEDVNLGFKHRIQLYRPPPGSVTSGYPNGPGQYRPYNPNIPNYVPPQNVPGFPNNIPRYVPPNQQQTPAKKDDDDSDDTDNDN
ncbi:MAG TPA: hypothetical protein VL327_02530 [Pyrinomonadaceae bacterium]|jgi:hypothetical protein|nr:hypothetical protein [Pyrinomonadaceae bacterium]